VNCCSLYDHSTQKLILLSWVDLGAGCKGDPHTIADGGFVPRRARTYSPGTRLSCDVVGMRYWRLRRGLAGGVRRRKASSMYWCPSTLMSISTRWDAPRSSSKIQNRYLRTKFILLHWISSDLVIRKTKVHILTFIGIMILISFCFFSGTI